MQERWLEALQSKRKKLVEQLKDPAAVGFWHSVIDKYSEQAHFLYELLQNSDDAHASEVQIYLDEQQLTYLHNGSVPFTLTDPSLEGTDAPLGHINSITSIGASSKQESNKIGKFGVGFKSVFQYTDRPHIEDDHFSFDIVDYIVPQQTARRCALRRPGECAFLFPLLDAQKSRTAILHKLNHLQYPLLFLPHLQQIRWDSLGETGIYRKEILETIPTEAFTYQRVCLTNPQGESDYFLLFNQCIEGGLTLAIAWRCDKEGALLPIVDEPLYCYFPTQQKESLNYLLHAPFLLTENRERLKQEEPWNDRLMQQSAQLVVRSLEWLKSRERAFSRTPIWQLLQWDQPVAKHHLHKQTIDQCLADARLFTTDRGSVIGRQALFAEDEAQTRLFSAEMIAQLFPELAGSRWCESLLYQLNDYQLRGVITHLVDTKAIHYLTANDCLYRLSQTLTQVPNLLKGKASEWFVRFYTYLSRHQQLDHELWKRLPMILCADGEVRAAYASSESLSAQLFLHKAEVLESQLVHPSVVESASARRFLESIGLRAPGLYTEIVEEVLPAYQEGRVAPENINLQVSYWSQLLSYYQSLPLVASGSQDSRSSFAAMLRTIPLVPVEDQEGRCTLQCIGDCYLKSPALTDLLQGVDVYFLTKERIIQLVAPEMRDTFYDLLLTVGIRVGLTLQSVRREPTACNHEQLDLHPVSLRQQDKGAQEIIDRVILEFDAWMKNPSPRKSAAFFQLVSEELKRQTPFLYRQSLEGTYTYYEKGKRTPTEEKIRCTTAFRSLFRTPWLYNQQGERKTPAEISESNQLSACYDCSQTDVLFLLGIRLSDDLRELTQEQREAVELVSRYKALGMTREEIDRVLSTYLQEKNN